MDDFRDDIEQCVRTLRKGGIILYPTDTVWGIGCDATNPVAVKSIFGLKKRSEVRSMIILLENDQELDKYVKVVDHRIFQFLRHLLVPTTVIYPGAQGLASNIIPKDGSIAIRIVHEAFCLTLIRAFQKPIVSTSANISGEPTPGYFDQIDKKILKGVDYIVRYRQDERIPGKPSTLVKYNIDGTTTLVRN